MHLHSSSASSPLKIVYLTPALYMAGGVERVLTLKASYLADHCGYDVTIILTEGRGKPLFYPLSDRVKVVNLDIGFEALWECSFLKKVFVYLGKQWRYRRQLRAELMRLRPDVTVSLLRREINFLSGIADGSRKVGELHINRANYRNFSDHDRAIGFSPMESFKRLFARLWMGSLVGKLRQLDRLVVLTEKDREAWVELSNVEVIPDPLPFVPTTVSPLTERRVVAVARYSHEKGIDLLLQAWSQAQREHPDWRLDVYGDGDRTPYLELSNRLGIDGSRCALHGRTSDVEQVYVSGSIFVLSSRFEGFGMVMVEAMACGLPVVAFDCPWGPRSIVSHGHDGLLADNGNPADLASKLGTLMGDAQLRATMASAALASVQRYRLETIMARWVALFESL